MNPHQHRRWNRITVSVTTKADFVAQSSTTMEQVTISARWMNVLMSSIMKTAVTSTVTVVVTLQLQRFLYLSPNASATTKDDCVAKNSMTMAMGMISEPLMSALPMSTIVVTLIALLVVSTRQLLQRPVFHHMFNNSNTNYTCLYLKCFPI